MQINIYIPLWLDLLFFLQFHNRYFSCIYIPLWLDLLFGGFLVAIGALNHLHSTMVRFIINVEGENEVELFYLHSTMVRFIIDAEDEQNQVIVKFTFHYG